MLRNWTFFEAYSVVEANGRSVACNAPFTYLYSDARISGE